MERLGGWVVHRDIRQIGRWSPFSLLFALSLKRRAGRDVELQLYNTIDGGMQGVGVKSICLSNLRVQPLLDSVTECDAKCASGALPIVGPATAGIQELIGDIDRFVKEWTGMFDSDELSAGAEDPEDRLSKLDASIHIRPTDQPDDTGHLQVDNPAAAKGKETHSQLQPGPSGSTASVSILQAPTLAGTNMETAHFDVTPATLTRMAT